MKMFFCSILAIFGVLIIFSSATIFFSNEPDGAGYMFLFGLILIYPIFSLARKQQNKNSQSIKSNEPLENYDDGEIFDDDDFENDFIYYNVVGIWSSKANIQAFQSLIEGDKVRIFWEEWNGYDKNAIAVETLKGRDIGHLPKGQRKLIRLIKEAPKNEIIVTVSEHAQFFSKPKNKEIYRLELTIPY